MISQLAPVQGAPAVPNVTARRFFIVHLVSYGVALPWGAAAVPIIFMHKQAELLAMTGESEAVLFVVRLASFTVTIFFVVAHLFGIPWILAARRGTTRGFRLFVGGSSLLLAIGVGVGIFGWSVFLRS